MRIMDLVLQQGLRSLAIVGLTKNVGKTVTLNYVLTQAFKEGYRVGIASMGRDGEKEDILTRRMKPRIEVPPGALVVTAQDALQNSRAVLRPVESTGIMTPLGEVYLYEVRRAGNVEVVGPRTQHQLQTVVSLLVERSDLALLDGAINRVLSASPAVSDGTILAVGASLSKSMKNVVRQARYRTDTLSLPPLEDPYLRERALEELEEVKVVLLDRSRRWHTLNAPTSFSLGPRLEARLTRGIEKVFLGGALTDSILKAVLDSPFLQEGELIIGDGTKVFVDPMLWNKFRLHNGRVAVLNPINLVAITANPWSPNHYSFEPETFLEALSRDIPDYPILDVMAGYGFWQEQRLAIDR